MQRYFNVSPLSGRRDNNVKNVEISDLLEFPPFVLTRKSFAGVHF